MRTGDKVLGGAGWVFFLCMMVWFASKYGREWEFGPRWKAPVSLIHQTERGYFYRDGSPAHFADVLLHRTGMEEEIMAVVMYGLALFTLWFIADVFLTKRKWARKWGEINQRIAKANAERALDKALVRPQVDKATHEIASAGAECVEKLLPASVSPQDKKEVRALCYDAVVGALVLQQEQKPPLRKPQFSLN